jgi:hypothetical protein
MSEERFRQIARDAAAERDALRRELANYKAMHARTVARMTDLQARIDSMREGARDLAAMLRGDIRS